MKAFFYHLTLTWKMDLRNKGILIMFYIVPLVFYAFIGGIFSSIMPDIEGTLIQTMSIFGISMGAYLGGPMGPSAIFGSDIRKAYHTGDIPYWTVVVTNILSGTIHLFIMQMVILLTAPMAFGAILPENMVLYLLSMLLFIIACMMLGTVLGLFIHKESLLTMCSQLLFLPSIMLSGVMFPAEMLPSVFQKISYIFPATWGFQLLTFTAENILPQIFLSAIIAICLILSFFRLRQLRTI